MSSAVAVPESATRPTERRGGRDIEPRRVECWACEATGVTEKEINRCRCGRWFEVVDDGGGDE